VEEHTAAQDERGQRAAPDCRKFTRQPGPPPGWTLSLARQSGLHHAVRLIHTTLVDAAAP
jgi:hypothetical protein